MTEPTIYNSLVLFLIALFSYLFARGSEILISWKKKKQCGQFEIPLEKTIQQAIEINILLSLALERFGADRVYLAKFHNGQHYVDGSEIQKKTRTHERVREGVSTQELFFHDQLLSTLQEEIQLLASSNHPTFTYIKDLPICRFRWMCEQGGVVAIIRCVLKKKGEIVGFVGADYLDGKDVREPENLADFTEIAYHINGILGEY